jgi:hypothetical protein
LTLPSGLCNGVPFQITRQDTIITNTVTLSVTTGTIYINAATSSTTYQINTESYTEIVSYGNDWYINKNTLINPYESRGIIATTLVSTNSSPYITLTGAQTNYGLIRHFGSTNWQTNIKSISKLYICVTGIANTTTGTITTSFDPSFSLSVSIAQGTTQVIYSGAITAFSTANNDIIWNGTSSSSDKMGLYSVFLS